MLTHSLVSAKAKVEPKEKCSEQVISGELLCDVIEHGTITPKYYQYETYEQMISLANTEITEIFEKNKNIESSMKIFQREIRKYLNQ